MAKTKEQKNAFKKKIKTHFIAWIITFFAVGILLSILSLTGVWVAGMVAYLILGIGMLIWMVVIVLMIIFYFIEAN